MRQVGHRNVVDLKWFFLSPGQKVSRGDCQIGVVVFTTSLSCSPAVPAAYPAIILPRSHRTTSISIW